MTAGPEDPDRRPDGAAQDRPPGRSWAAPDPWVPPVGPGAGSAASSGPVPGTQPAPWPSPAPGAQPAPWSAYPVLRTGPEEAWQPRRYPQLLRGPNHSWWRPLAGLGLMIAMVFALAMALGLVLFVIELAGGNEPADMQLRTDPPAILMMNLTLASLVPLSMVTVWVVHGWRPRWVASVRGGVRWGWLLLCAVVSSAVMAPVVLGFLVLDDTLRWKPEPGAVWLIAVVLLTTPLQSAGEEYLFRGWMLQAMGSLFRRGAVAVLVSGTVSSVLFALAHGEQDPWLFLDRFGFAVLAVWLVWATGGLEAGIALHAANNVMIMIPAVLTGTFSHALTTTSSDPLSAAVSVVLTGVLTGILVALGRWRRLTVTFQPPPRPVPAVASA